MHCRPSHIFGPNVYFDTQIGRTWLHRQIWIKSVQMHFWTKVRGVAGCAKINTFSVQNSHFARQSVKVRNFALWKVRKSYFSSKRDDLDEAFSFMKWKKPLRLFSFFFLKRAEQNFSQIFDQKFGSKWSPHWPNWLNFWSKFDKIGQNCPAKPGSGTIWAKFWLKFIDSRLAPRFRPNSHFWDQNGHFWYDSCVKRGSGLIWPPNGHFVNWPSLRCEVWRDGQNTIFATLRKSRFHEGEKWPKVIASRRFWPFFRVFENDQNGQKTAEKRWLSVHFSRPGSMHSCTRF